MILDLFFPKRCVGCGKIGSYLCPLCYKKVEIVGYPVCPYCLRQAIGGSVHLRCKKPDGLDGLVIACRYRGPVRSLITKFKYKYVRDILDILVDLLEKNISTFNMPKDVVLVPVPLHPKRKRWRGFNQSELIARELGARLGIKSADLLKRVRETRGQVTLVAKDRQDNIIGAFKISGKVKNGNYILVDDVYTTGATMRECASVLKAAGAGEVWGMVVALG